MKLEIGPADIAGLKSRLVAGETRSIHWGALPDIEDHFRHMRQDFTGLPELCFVHGKLVALIRRRIDLAHHVPTFLSLWEAETEFLITHLNSRWLLSACDTMACHADRLRRSNAVVLTAMFHMLQLCETERIVMLDSRYDPSRYAAAVGTHAAKTHIPLWDGVKAAAFEHCDSGRNMLTYVLGVVDGDAVVGPIARTLIARALAGDTLFRRLTALNSYFLPPALSGETVDSPQPRLTGAVNGHNIVLVGGRYLVVPQAAGPLDLTKPENLDRPDIRVTDNLLDAVHAARAGASV